MLLWRQLGGNYVSNYWQLYNRNLFRCRDLEISFGLLYRMEFLLELMSVKFFLLNKIDIVLICSNRSRLDMLD